jgi:hypothetical protein
MEGSRSKDQDGSWAEGGFWTTRQSGDPCDGWAVSVGHESASARVDKLRFDFSEG